MHLLEYLRDRVGFDKLAEKVKKPLHGLARRLLLRLPAGAPE